MNDSFKRSLVVCAAISTFGGGIYLGDSIIKSYIRSSVVASQVLSASEQSAADDNAAEPTASPKPKAAFTFSFGK